MSLVNYVPIGTLPIETFNRFEAQWNVTPNKYDFGVNVANANQTVLAMNNRYWYFIDRVSFSASVDEGVYLKSIDTQPLLFFSYRNVRYRVYPRALPAVNYKDNMEFNFFFHSQKEREELRISMTGVLHQEPETVGVSSIFAQVSFVIYQIEGLDFVNKLREAQSKAIGRVYSHGIGD